MADPNEAKINLPYIGWKEGRLEIIKDTQLNNLTVGWVGPASLLRRLEESGCLPNQAGNTNPKLTDINWKTVTDRIFDTDFVDWEAADLKGRAICECFSNRGIHINKMAICHASILGAGMIDGAWTKAI